MSEKVCESKVCSHRLGFMFDNVFRRLFQSPGKVVGAYVEEGDTVIDIGCGPGYFSIDMAKMVGAMGRVYAVDLQKEMLVMARKKAAKKSVADQMKFHQCGAREIGLGKEVKADFIVAFYMVHEVPDQRFFLKQIKGYMKTGGKFLIVEPTFHVTGDDFKKTTDLAKETGFSILDSPKGKGGRALLLTA